MNSWKIYCSWIWRTVICLALLCLLLELVTRLGFTRLSHIESRIAVEHRAALAIRKGSGTKQILLLGNSLPLEGIALSQLNRDLGARAHCTRFVIEATEYLDWYYGLRRLFADGSDPDIVLLCIDATHLKSFGIRDYSAFYLFRVRDIPIVGKAAHYDLTKTAGLFFAHYSLFYAGRNGIRNYVLNHADDPYAELVRNLPKPPGSFSRQETDPEPLEAQRLTAIRQLCGEKTKQFVLLIPPGFGSGNESVQAAGKDSATEVMIPVRHDEFGRELFRDGYHLTEAGAKSFTARLATELNGYLDSGDKQVVEIKQLAR